MLQHKQHLDWHLLSAVAFSSETSQAIPFFFISMLRGAVKRAILL
jgi:hypothetical protein